MASNYIHRSVVRSNCGDFAVYTKFGALLRNLLAIATVVCCGQAFAGSPPLITDDPETPGYQGWEINITSSLEHTRSGTAMENPFFDINYGLTSDRDQLDVEFAVVSNDPEGADAEWGISDLLVGYKYRFLNADENHGWAVSFYPQVTSPTGDENRGLGSGQTELFFPFEFQKSFCDDKVWVNPEIGYNVVFGHLGSQNNWKFGLATGREYENGWELEAEVGAFVFEGNSGEPDFPFFNFGFEYTINKNVHLLGSAGRGFRSSTDGTPDFFCLLGFQFLLGKAAEESDPSHEEGKDKGGDEDKAKGGGDEASTSGFPGDSSARAANRELRRSLVNPAAY
jgi:hypothetical protein